MVVTYCSVLVKVPTASSSNPQDIQRKLYYGNNFKPRKALVVKQFNPLHNSSQPYVTGHKLDFRQES
jgi:hypothetical protein